MVFVLRGDLLYLKKATKNGRRPSFSRSTLSNIGEESSENGSGSKIGISKNSIAGEEERIEIQAFDQLNGEHIVFADSISKENVRIRGNVEISSQEVIIGKISIFKAYKILRDDFEDIRKNQTSILNIRNKRGSQRLNQSSLRQPVLGKSQFGGGRRKRGGIALGGLPGLGRSARNSISP